MGLGLGDKTHPYRWMIRLQGLAENTSKQKYHSVQILLLLNHCVWFTNYKTNIFWMAINSPCSLQTNCWWLLPFCMRTTYLYACISAHLDLSKKDLLAFVDSQLIKSLSDYFNEECIGFTFLKLLQEFLLGCVLPLIFKAKTILRT